MDGIPSVKYVKQYHLYGSLASKHAVARSTVISFYELYYKIFVCISMVTDGAADRYKARFAVVDTVDCGRKRYCEVTIPSFHTQEITALYTTVLEKIVDSGNFTKTDYFLSDYEVDPFRRLIDSTL